MADFGKKGKITVRVPNVGGETVDLSQGEHLCYKITALGGLPIFNLMGNKQVLWTQQDFGPKMNYEIEWPRTPNEVVSKSADYLFSMSFFNDGTYKLKYTLRVEYHDSSHKVKEVITDKDYESDEPTDACEEKITVETK
jgi:hypothetical protein